MAKTICVGTMKGGVGKTTTAGILAHELSKNARVLAVDTDVQGDLSSLLSRIEDPMEFGVNTVLEAIQKGDVRPYIHQVNEQLHLVPAHNSLAQLARYLYQTHGFDNPKTNLRLKEALSHVQDAYNYIIIDTPPALSESSLLGLAASSHVIVMSEASHWSQQAILNFLGSVEAAKQWNPSLQVAGILRTLNDAKRYDTKIYNEMIADQYPDLVFDTVIRRKATTGRLSSFGFNDNAELTDALDQYQLFCKELMTRV